MENKPHYQLYIDGDWVSGSTQQSMDSENPATGEIWATFDCASKSDVNRAVSAARRALSDTSWRDISQIKLKDRFYQSTNQICTFLLGVNQLALL